MNRLIACTILAAALAGNAMLALAQGNPVDIRKRDDAERPLRDYRAAVSSRDAAPAPERAARQRNQMLPEPIPVPAINPSPPVPVLPGVNPDPALRIQQEETA